MSSSRRLASCTSASTASTSARRAFRWVFARLRASASMRRSKSCASGSGQQEQGLPAGPRAHPAASGRRARSGRTSRQSNPSNSAASCADDIRITPSRTCGPDELAAFQALVNEHHPGLVPDQQLDEDQDGGGDHAEGAVGGGPATRSGAGEGRECFAPDARAGARARWAEPDGGGGELRDGSADAARLGPSRQRGGVGGSDRPVSSGAYAEARSGADE